MNLLEKAFRFCTLNNRKFYHIWLHFRQEKVDTLKKYNPANLHEILQWISDYAAHCMLCSLNNALFMVSFFQILKEKNLARLIKQLALKKNLDILSALYPKFSFPVSSKMFLLFFPT